ncbi:MAG TPA: glutamate ABC transporter substrate-binding protein [Vitreimonas sp.]|nr:glutamate ABC transporter substrate-binding protein [Vitreimonas sp.]
MQRLLATLGALSLILAACTGGPGASPGGGAGATDGGAGTAPSFPADSTMAEIQQEGKLVCGVKFDVIAFGFMNPTNNEVEGFDADLCREIATGLGVEPEFVETVSANRIPFLQEDKVDIVISTMTINEERKQEIDFSHEYYHAGQSILVMSDNAEIQSVDDLDGTTVCTVEGSTSEKNVREQAPGAELLLFKSYSEAAQALVDGRCESVSTDDSILFGLASQFEGTELRGEPFSDEPLGIGVKKGKDDLVQFINGVLEDMGDDGRWTALYDKHIKPYSGKDAPEPPFKSGG